MSAPDPEDLEIPPATFTDRREQLRRDEDVARETLTQTVFRTGKIAAAMLAIGTLLGAVGGSLGQRIVGPRDDLNDARRAMRAGDSALAVRIDGTEFRLGLVRGGQDSLLTVLRSVQATQEMQGYTLCIIARELAPTARPKGCDAVGGRGGIP